MFREASMLARRKWMLVALLLTPPVTAATGNVITDWDGKAVTLVQPGTVFPAPTALRTTAILHLAMFEAVNSIERRYRPYRGQAAAAPDTSQEAAAASAAGAVLMKLVPNAAADIQTAVTSYLEKLPEGEAKSAGIKLGQEVAAGILEMRANDGAAAADAYRPRTKPGVYIPTAITIGWAFSHVTPFALTSPSQFRPKPPPALESAEWARDYNEIKELGEKNSTRRTARQTEDARFWISVNPGMSHQLERQIVVAKNMDTVDSAHFMAVVSMAEADAGVALFEAKYKYEFWRPITAIRNGDIDGNPATKRDATWQPIDVTPMHPEYPCAHCIINSAVAAVVKAVLGTDEIPEVALTSPFTPGVTHRFASLRAYTDEIAGARIYAGFHYRFSTVVGTDMGHKIGEYVTKTVMQPAQAAMAR
jgi:hypothetical protein